MENGIFLVSQRPRPCPYVENGILVVSQRPRPRRHTRVYKTTPIASRAPELRSCVKFEVDVLGSPSLIVRTVSEGAKQRWTNEHHVPPVLSPLQHKNLNGPRPHLIIWTAAPQPSPHYIRWEGREGGRGERGEKEGEGRGAVERYSELCLTRRRARPRFSRTVCT